MKSIPYLIAAACFAAAGLSLKEVPIAAGLSTLAGILIIVREVAQRRD
jgi:hypothetical protein